MNFSLIRGIIMEEEVENQKEEEEDYAQALRWERQSRKQEIVEKVSEETRTEIESLIPLVRNKKKLAIVFPLALLFAVASDAADIIFVIPAIPIVGDILDLSTAGILAMIFWPIKGANIKFKIMLVDGVAMFIELLPFVITDELPTFTIAVIMTGLSIYRKANQAKKQIAELKKVDPDQISEEALSEEFE